MINENKERLNNIKIIKKKNKPHNNKQREVNNTEDNIIDINGVYKFYTNGLNIFKALDNINIKIKKGSFVVILGKSGSGKSTLMNIMSGLIRASEGDVIVNGKNLITFKNKELTNFRAENCGFIFQQYGLLSTLTVEENIMTGLNLGMIANRKKNENKDFIYGIMKRIGIYELKDKFPDQLSGGQQQRVSIARAIAKKPLILFGDEPTGAVDSSMTYNILKLLKDINENVKMTVILITHDDRLLNIADHAIRIEDGKIIEDKVQHPAKDFMNFFI